MSAAGLDGVCFSFLFFSIAVGCYGSITAISKLIRNSRSVARDKHF